jgi:hypothetical protein
MTPVCVICELCCQGRSCAWLLHPSHFTSKKRGGKCLEIFAVCYDNAVLALNSLQTHTRYEHRGLMYRAHFDESGFSVQAKRYDAIQVQDCNGS